LRTPAFDLGPFLNAHKERWRVREVNDPMSAAASHDAGLDAIVLGFNAIYDSTRPPRSAARLRRPPGNLVVLHQLEAECFGFLRGELALEVRPFEAVELHAIAVPKERRARNEPLLTWPHDLIGDFEGTSAKAQALYGFQPDPESLWRVVLEALVGGERVPVLMRTAMVMPERLVACSLLLEWRDDWHAVLLDNILTYCGLGSPNVAVVTPGSEDEYDVTAVVERLRLRGAYAVTLPPGDRFEIGTLPGTVKHVIAPVSLAPDEVFTDDARARAWAKGGGILARMGRDGELTAHSRASDEDWVGRRWATWYGGRARDDWERRLSSARAVLQMLARIDDREGALGAEQLAEYPAEDIAEYLAKRVKDGNCEETISATAMAWDIHRLLGGRGLTSGNAREVEGWLRGAFGRAPGADLADMRPPPVEDQLDIARALTDADLLRRAWNRMADEPVTALSLTRMREALVACDAGREYTTLPDSVREALDSEAVVAELEDRPLLAAEFLYAAAALEHAVQDHPVATLHGPAVRTALSVVCARGVLGRYGDDIDPEAVGATQITTEALALMEHMRERPTSTWQIKPESDDVPALAVQEVLREGARTRKASAKRAAETRALGLALWLMSTLAAAAAALAIGWRFGSLDLDAGIWITLIASVVIAFFALLLLRRLRRERPVNAFAGDLLGALGLVAAGALAAAVPQLLGFIIDDASLLQIVGSLASVIVVFGLLASAILGWLDSRHLAPPWGEWLVNWMADRNVPMVSRARREQTR
jgi:hypothetical protein